MAMWDFTLNFRLPPGKGDPTLWLDALFEAGCDDATVGVGRPGAIALDFSREAENAESAVLSAINAVRIAIPGADLTETSPDLAELVGCSCQNLPRYVAENLLFR